MTTYDDPEVNALMARVELVSDDSVATLCCVIETELSDGTRAIEDLRMTASDYAYGWDETVALIRRIGAESGVPQRAYDLIEAFCRDLPAGSIAMVLDAFSELDKLDAAAE